MHWKRAGLLGAGLVLSVMGSGCYLGHLARGQVSLLCARTPVAAVLADPDAPPELRERLERVEQVRRDARDLGLDVGEVYTSYVPWPGKAIVTSVVATRPGEVEPITSWFPIVGRVPYRGYFDPARADAEAERLRGEGRDVCRVEVPAYSTLGWFDDPLTGPMLRQPEPRLVETLFHELLHATVFVPGDADFNEGVASFFGEEARVRFYAAHGGPVRGERERLAVTRQRRQRAEVLALRAAVAKLYAEQPAGSERSAQRARLEAEARTRLASLSPGEGAERTGRLRLNDACLALSGTYHGDTPRLAAVLDALDGDLAAFLVRVRRAAESDAPRRELLGDPGPPEGPAP